MSIAYVISIFNLIYNYIHEVCEEESHGLPQTVTRLAEAYGVEVSVGCRLMALIKKALRGIGTEIITIYAGNTLVDVELSDMITRLKITCVIVECFTVYI